MSYPTLPCHPHQTYANHSLQGSYSSSSACKATISTLQPSPKKHNSLHSGKSPEITPRPEDRKKYQPGALLHIYHQDRRRSTQQNCSHCLLPVARSVPSHLIPSAWCFQRPIDVMPASLPSPLWSAADILLLHHHRCSHQQRLN